MSIPNSQLDTWSNQGATVTPKDLREKIEKVILAENSLVQYKNQLNIYLQGSYRNSTNIYGNSDVDVVVQSNKTYYYDTSNLTMNEQSNFENAFLSATYNFSELRQEIFQTLVNQFGSGNVLPGSKSIKVKALGYEADVVPAFQYRKYTQFGQSDSQRNFIEGIHFYTNNGYQPVINFPKVHYSNGTVKNSNTNNMFKPTVRIFKNMKKKLISDGKIDNSLAPSYYLECLLYNVPNGKFINNDYASTVYNILLWLHESASNLDSLVCQNGQVYLFGNSDVQWRTYDAQLFISRLVGLWNDWGK